MNITAMSAATAKTAALPANCIGSVRVTVASMNDRDRLREGPPPGTLGRSTIVRRRCSRQSGADRWAAYDHVPVSMPKAVDTLESQEPPRQWPLRLDQDRLPAQAAALRVD